MSDAIPFIRDDGGRAAAGFRGSTGDCVTRALAIATGRPYRDVYGSINALARVMESRHGGSTARLGTSKTLTRLAMRGFGFEWTPTMTVGSGCQVHLRADELPGGVLIVRVTRHVAAVVDGVLRDTHDCSREGTRCVYGYWSPRKS